MKYNELIISVSVGNLETVSGICQMLVPYGIYIEDYSDLDAIARGLPPELIDEDLLKKDKSTALIHVYIQEDKNLAEALSFLEERLSSEKIPHSVARGLVDEEDYANSWKKYFHPLKIGENLVVAPTWESYNKQGGEVIVNLDPGMAFGTGAHETTRLCMRLLEKYVPQYPGCDILDIGCGSGILAVTGVLLGAESAFGCDIDPLAVKVAKENSVLNNTLDKTEFAESDLTGAVRGSYDIICANIAADAVIKLSGQVKPFFKARGLFICSGIIRLREAEVRAALEEQGFALCDALEENGWYAFAANSL
ncbi:MAG: 50S ribosomal protein L11 methyltransferase [Oscillospiraceae bacterium]|jgi:ribosomal protein L11 methyltransferase|nr:50S ribosomal protein L11 methyltransferase [Oscillospiraceae bacterium]